MNVEEYKILVVDDEESVLIVVRQAFAGHCQVLTAQTGEAALELIKKEKPALVFLDIGMPGMHGTVAAVGAMQKSDLLITLGARFDDRVTGRLSTFAPDAKIIHADIDPAEIGKNREVDVPIVGDAREVMIELIGILTAEQANGNVGEYSEWLQTTLGWKAKYPSGYETFADGTLAPQYVIERLSALSDEDTIYTSGVGQHQMWASHFINWKKPGTWLNSGGLGTMGVSVPFAMGAKVAQPGRTVWSIDGDGCFQMTNQELVTCSINEVPIKVALINNSSLGMVRQWQTLFYNERYSNTDLHSHRIPDFVKLAEAYGCHGLRCESAADVDKTIKLAQSLNDAPVVVDFIVHRDAMIWPMVAAGASNDDIKIARGLAPEFEQGAE